VLSRRRQQDLGDSERGTGDHLEVRRPARSVLPHRPAAHGRSYPYVLTQVASLDAFGEPLTIDYPVYTAGQVMLESADRLVAEETEPALQQYVLLMGALRALDGGTSDAPRPATSIWILACCGRWRWPAVHPRFQLRAVVSPGRAGHSPPPRAGSSASDAPAPEQRGPLPKPWPCSLPCSRTTGARRVRCLIMLGCEVSGTSAFVAWHLDRNLRSLAHVER
jgi:DNA repair protein RecO (recombination protein O)